MGLMEEMSRSLDELRAVGDGEVKIGGQWVPVLFKEAKDLYSDDLIVEKRRDGTRTFRAVKVVHSACCKGGTHFEVHSGTAWCFEPRAIVCVIA